jgi:geranylgeranyl pyrophosphate synthase
MTLPLVLAMAEAPDLVQLVAQVHAGAAAATPSSADESAMLLIRERVVELGVCSEVRRRARAHTSRALRALERVPEGPARALLEAVAAELNERSA